MITVFASSVDTRCKTFNKIEMSTSCRKRKDVDKKENEDPEHELSNPLKKRRKYSEPPKKTKKKRYKYLVNPYYYFRNGTNLVLFKTLNFLIVQQCRNRQFCLKVNLFNSSILLKGLFVQYH